VIVSQDGADAATAALIDRYTGNGTLACSPGHACQSLLPLQRAAM